MVPVLRAEANHTCETTWTFTHVTASARGVSNLARRTGYESKNLVRAKQQPYERADTNMYLVAVAATKVRVQEWRVCLEVSEARNDSFCQLGDVSRQKISLNFSFVRKSFADRTSTQEITKTGSLILYEKVREK